jgi:hypothetical protein
MGWTQPRYSVADGRDYHTGPLFYEVVRKRGRAIPSFGPRFVEVLGSLMHYDDLKPRWQRVHLSNALTYKVATAGGHGRSD